MGDDELKAGNDDEDDDIDKSPAGLGRLHGWICDGFSKGKKECALYVSDLKPYKLLSDAMVDVGKLAVQFVYKLEIFGKGCAGFSFNNLENCQVAQAKLKEAFGESVTLYSGLDAPTAVMSLNAKELSGQLQVEHMLMIEDYPGDASMAAIALLFPNAIFMARIHEAAAAAGEKRWFEKSFRHSKERYEPPANYKTLVVVQFCSSHEVQAAAEAHAARVLSAADVTTYSCQTLALYEEQYKKDFEKKRRDMTLERIYPDPERLQMLDVLFEKREQLRVITQQIRRTDASEEDRLKHRKLSKEVNDITAALRIDSGARVKVGMAVPEGVDKFTKHTRYLYQSRKITSKKETERAKERQRVMEKEREARKAAGDKEKTVDKSTP